LLVKFSKLSLKKGLAGSSPGKMERSKEVRSELHGYDMRRAPISEYLPSRQTCSMCASMRIIRTTALGAVYAVCWTLRPCPD
ncbi:hypothetical protein FA15DRAFT_666338, partial [Coprinopsis marcescibilis]